MKNIIMAFGLFFVTSLVYAGDEVSQLRDIAIEVEEHRDLTIDCLIELEVSKKKGWNSEQCLSYQNFLKSTFPTFKSKVKEQLVSFKKFAKSPDASRRSVKLGLKQAVIIQQNLTNIKNISNKIKSAVNK